MRSFLILCSQQTYVQNITYKHMSTFKCEQHSWDKTLMIMMATSSLWLWLFTWQGLKGVILLQLCLHSSNISNEVEICLYLILIFLLTDHLLSIRDRKGTPIRILRRQYCHSIFYKFPFIISFNKKSRCFLLLWMHRAKCLKTPSVANGDDSNSRASMVNMWSFHPSLGPTNYSTQPLSILK